MAVQQTYEQELVRVVVLMDSGGFALAVMPRGAAKVIVEKFTRQELVGIVHSPEMTFAVKADRIEGLYFMEIRKDPAERMAEAVERQISEGEEWRGLQ